jgi:nitrilase
MPHFSLGLTANTGSNRAYAIEVGTFVVMATAPISEQNAKYLCGDDQDKRRMLSPGGGASMIYSPEGRELSEKLDSASEGIIYAEIDVAKAYLAKSALDIVGHYARSDIFQVSFDAHPRSAVTAPSVHGSPLAAGSSQARQSRQTAFERMEVTRPACTDGL